MHPLARNILQLLCTSTLRNIQNGRADKTDLNFIDCLPDAVEYFGYPRKTGDYIQKQMLMAWPDARKRKVPRVVQEYKYDHRVALLHEKGFSIRRISEHLGLSRNNTYRCLQESRGQVQKEFPFSGDTLFLGRVG